MKIKNIYILPAAPDNSVESDELTEGAEIGDARLSLSMTDQQVQLKLPGDRTGEGGVARPSGGVMEMGKWQGGQVELRKRVEGRCRWE